MGKLMVGALIFVFSLGFLAFRRRHEQVKVRFKQGLEAVGITIAAFLVVWLAYLLIFTPKRLVEDARQKAQEAQKERETAKADLMAASKNTGQSQAVIEHKREVMDKLGEFIAEGSQLMSRCAAESRVAPESEANDWGSRVENFLGGNLGQSYIYRSRSAAGLPLMATSITDQAHRQLWSGIAVRVARLEQFLEELSKQP